MATWAAHSANGRITRLRACDNDKRQRKIWRVKARAVPASMMVPGRVVCEPSTVGGLQQIHKGTVDEVRMRDGEIHVSTRELGVFIAEPDAHLFCAVDHEGDWE